MNSIMHITLSIWPLSKSPSLPEKKTCFLPIRTGLPAVAYQPPSLGVVLRGGRGVRGSSPGNFFSFKVAEPPKIKFLRQPGPVYANRRVCKQNQSLCRRLDARPNRPRIVRKRRHDRMFHAFDASSGQIAEVTPIQSRRHPPFNN